jgi:hypothetical protein
MGGKVYSGYGLPYEPRVTPGLAVAGVFLMIAGLGCCFIGIKIKRYAELYDQVLSYGS